MKKLLIIILMSVIIISLVGATESYIFKKGNLVDLKVPCHNETNHLCPSTTTCNITIFYPNNTVIVDNREMTFNDAYFNYTLIGTEVDVLGEYSVDATCFGTTSGHSTFTFLITTAGEKLSTASAIIYMIVLIASLFVFILCLYGAVIIPWKNSRGNDGRIVSINDLKWVKLALWFGSYFILMWIFFIAEAITGQFLFLNVASNFFNMLFWLMLSAMFPLMIVMLIIGVVTVVQDKKWERLMKRGIFPK